jgi:CheY-like chemotaxis protein
LSNTVHLLQRASVRDEDFVRRMADNMDRQVRQLVRLVDDLLDVSRITHGRLELRNGTVELAAILEQAVQASTPLAARANHQVRVTLPNHPVYLHADSARLIQVFANLLNNSCKYTRPNGDITVHAQSHATYVEVSVEDNGIGIPREKLECIFEPFVQLDRSSEKSIGGMGIGLALVQAFGADARRLRGSEQSGGGKRQPVRRSVAIIKEHSIAPLDPRNSEQQNVAPVVTRRILVVDDNRDAADSLAQLLEMSGHAVVTAHDGIGALAAASEFEPDIVLLDIGMPGMDGHEVCRRLRTLPRGREMSILALTGWGQEADCRRSQAAGFRPAPDKTGRLQFAHRVAGCRPWPHKSRHGRETWRCRTLAWTASFAGVTSSHGVASLNPQG